MEITIEKINSVYGMMAQDLRAPSALHGTACVRYMLEERVRLGGGEFVYCDTDSIKCIDSISIDNS